MTLEKQPAVIPFAGGIETNQNEFLVQPPNLVDLTNGVFRKQGEISKRYGFSALSKAVFEDNDISVGKRVDTFNDDLVLFTDSNLYSYSLNSQQWFNRGAFAAVEVLKSSISRNRFSQTIPTITTARGVTLSAWEDSRNGVRYTIREDATGSVLLPETLVSNNASFPVCTTLADQYLCLFYIESGVLKSIMFEYSDIGNPWTNPNVVSVGSTEAFDVVPYQSYLILSYNDTSDDTTVTSLIFNSTTGVAVQGGTTRVFTSSTPYTSKSIAVIPDENRFTFYIASVLPDNSVRFQASFQDFTVPDTHNIQIAAAQANARSRITGVAKSNTGVITVLFEDNNTTDKNHFIAASSVTYGITTPPVASSLSTVKRSVGLGSHAFEENGILYVVSAHESELQPTYFLLELSTLSDSPISAKILSSIAGAHPAKNSLPRVLTDQQGRRFTSLLEVTRLQTAEEGTTVRDNTGVVRTTLNFNTPPFQSQQIGQNLLIAGGYITAYDGSRVVEHGFHLYPEDISATPAGGDPIPNGIYRVSALYEWTDAQGQVHRSAPSIPIQVTTSSQQINLTIPTLRLSAKEDVKIVVYATDTGGIDVLYRAGDVANDPSVDTVSFNIVNTGLYDGTPRQILTKEILYTTGDVVEAIAAPAASLVQTHQNRLFIGGLENENELWYTKESVQNEGLQFSDFFRIRVNPVGGGITALGTLDDKLIIFKENSIFALTGQGPVDTGAQNDFQQPEQISSQFGCTSPSSVTVTTQGLLFQSDDGIKLLDRGLQVIDIGGPVSDFATGAEVTSGTLLPKEDEVRFTTRDGRALVYNTDYNLWSTFDNYSAESGTIWRGAYVHLKADGTVNQETSEGYRDNNAPISLELTTPWLAFNGLLGYKRIYQIMMLGRKLTNHAFRVSIAYDYSDLTRQIVFFNTLEGMEPENYSPSASTVIPSRYSNVATGNSVFQFRIKPTIQKCESIRLKIKDIPLNGELGAGYVLTGLSALLGVDTKRQLPTAASQTIGE